MPRIDEREKRNAHPGWAVRFEDGSWLGCAHGYFRAPEAFFAYIYSSEEEALNDFNRGKEDLGNNIPKYSIIPAWEPLCEVLRLEIGSLRKICKFDSSDALELSMELEHFVDKLNAIWKDDK